MLSLRAKRSNLDGGGQSDPDCVVVALLAMTPMLVYMPIQEGSNSAASSLPGIPNSAAGRLEQIPSKSLIYRVFTMLEGRFLVAGSDFFPDRRENSDEPFPAQRGDFALVVAEGSDDLLGVLAEQRCRPAVGAGGLGELDR